MPRNVPSQFPNFLRAFYQSHAPRQLARLPPTLAMHNTTIDAGQSSPAPIRSHYCKTKSPLREDHPHTTCTADKQRMHSCRGGTIMAPLFPLSLFLLLDCSLSIPIVRVTEKESEADLPYPNLCHLLHCPLSSP